ncbi:hypothetical protein HY640_02810 [Candidatus Woesearchaeota archaeon]|nr:hypothetical protein [Candidatus Woesearchaeota archaeon]
MRSVVFDAGPVISLSMNNLLWLLEPLRKSFGGEFLIPEPVKEELVDRPLKIKRFEFEALQVQSEIDCGVFRVVNDTRVDALAKELYELANSCFSAKGSNISMLHFGEVYTLASVSVMGCEAAVVDERTTRELVESPEDIAKHMQAKLHTKVSIDYGRLDKLRSMVDGMRILRSVELVAVAFEMGLLDRYIDRCRNPTEEMRARLLDSVLWGVKLEGCAVSEKEIERIMSLEMAK